MPCNVRATIAPDDDQVGFVFPCDSGAYPGRPTWFDEDVAFDTSPIYEGFQAKSRAGGCVSPEPIPQIQIPSADTYIRRFRGMDDC